MHVFVNTPHIIVCLKLLLQQLWVHSNNVKNKSVFISVNFIQTDIQTCSVMVFDYPSMIFS